MYVTYILVYTCTVETQKCFLEQFMVNLGRLVSVWRSLISGADSKYLRLPGTRLTGRSSLLSLALYLRAGDLNSGLYP